MNEEKLSIILLTFARNNDISYVYTIETEELIKSIILAPDNNTLLKILEWSQNTNFYWLVKSIIDEKLKICSITLNKYEGNMTKVIEPLNLDFELQLDNSEKYYSHHYFPLFNLSGNVGFVTNSSSVIYSFPKEILLDENVAAFIKDHELHHGFIGDDLWQRDKCTSLAITKEQKIYINKKLNQEEEYYYESLCINENNDDIILIYGDEYDSIVSTLAQIMENAAKKLKIEFISRDYN